MGLLSDVVSKVKSSVVGKALDTLSAAFIKPIDTIEAIISPTKTVADVIKVVDKQSLVKNLVATGVTTATIGAAVVGAGVLATAAKSGKVLATVATGIKAVIPKTGKGKFIAAVAVPIAAGIAIKEPIKTAKAVLETPSSLVNVGSNLAGFIADPSLSTAKKIVQENPIVSTGVGLLTAGVVGGAALKVASSVVNYKATSNLIDAAKEPTQQIVNIPKTPEVIYAADYNGGSVSTLPPASPQLPQTQVVSPTTIKKKKRSQKRVQMQNIMQKVSVNVGNRKSYLNTIVLKR